MDSEKKFDSAEKILEILKEEKILPENMYLAFINAIYNLLANTTGTINGAKPEDFFIQGLIVIPGNIEAFEDALKFFMDEYNMKY